MQKPDLSSYSLDDLDTMYATMQGNEEFKKAIGHEIDKRTLDNLSKNAKK